MSVSITTPVEPPGVIGENIVITCEVTGDDPAATISWYADGNFIGGETQLTYEFVAQHSMNLSLIECRADNRLSDRDNVTLSFVGECQCRPRFLNPCCVKKGFFPLDTSYSLL